jgi:hypothetical protein
LESKILADQRIFPVLLELVILPVCHGHCKLLISKAENDDNDSVYNR